MTFYSGFELRDRASVPHAGRLMATKQTLLFREDVLGDAIDWQLIAFSFPENLGRMTKISVRIRTGGLRGSMIYIGLNQGINLCFFDPNLKSAATYWENAETNCIISEDIVNVNVSFYCDDGFFLVGTADARAQRMHSGVFKGQIEILSLEINDCLPAGSRPKLTIVDVGAAGGVDPVWNKFSNDIEVVMVEPDPQAVSQLDNKASRYVSKTIDTALWCENEVKTLYVTRMPYCASLRVPDKKFTTRYKVAPVFDVIRTVQIICRRYDSLYYEGNVPKPDFVKLDTQGTELEILQGFGVLLQECVAVQVEAHFYPLYSDQPLLGDLVKFLDTFDFRLRDLRPCRSFDGDYVEVDALFTKIIDDKSSSQMRGKLEFLEEVARSAGFDLQIFELGQRMAGQALS